MMTPEQFLTMPSDPEDDQEPAPPLEPLESIAFSLRFLVDRFEPEQVAAAADDGAQQRYDDLDQAYADLEAKHDVLRALVEEIEGIVKPSTSKLANQVRAAVQRWRAPEVPAGEPVDEEPGICSTHGWAHKFKTCAEVTAEQSVGGGDLELPGPDADVWEWRAYAIRLGHDNVEMGKLNRSQIRTMLGVDQPVNEVSA